MKIIQNKPEGDRMKIFFKNIRKALKLDYLSKCEKEIINCYSKKCHSNIKAYKPKKQLKLPIIKESKKDVCVMRLKMNLKLTDKEEFERSKTPNFGETKIDLQQFMSPLAVRKVPLYIKNKNSTFYTNQNITKN